MTQELNDNDKWLAAEFALGALDREAMQKAEHRYDSDLLFRSAVDAWQNDLAPMLEQVPDATPGSTVWNNIAARTGVAGSKESSGIWNSLSFWRGFSIVSGGLAAASFAALFYLSIAGDTDQDKRAGPLVATLSASGEAPTLLARYDPDTGQLFLRTALPQEGQEKSAELWLIPADSVPISLGLLESTSTQVALSRRNIELIEDGGTLAISMEPLGGSTTGAPTGPVIASGKLRKL